MNQIQKKRISIQVSLSGYSFTVSDQDGSHSSGWMGADRIFTTQELQRRYDEVEISLLTPKFALVPEQFFVPTKAAEMLAETVALRDSDVVEHVAIPQFGAVLLYSNSIDESLSKVISQTVFTSEGDMARVLPEMFYILRGLEECKEYNKIVATYRDGYLHLAIAQGRSLQLCNSFKAVDFTTAEYFLFLAMKSLQLNPEVSTICWRMPLSPEEEMSLYRYFKAVEQI